MARRKGGHKKKGFTLPLLAVSGFIPVVHGVWQHQQWYGAGGPEGSVDWFTRAMTGFSPNRQGGQTWSLARMKDGALPVAVGIIGHKIASKLGINRMLASAGVPFIRL